MKLAFLLSLICLLSCSHKTPVAVQGNQADAKLIETTAEKLREIIRRESAPLSVVNVWATWCAPCQKEFPAILETAHTYESLGLKLILVSADFASQKKDVVDFLRKHNVTFPTYLKKQADPEFISGVAPAWSGILPTTFFFDSKGELLSFIEGEISKELLNQKITTYLTAPKH